MLVMIVAAAFIATGARNEPSAEPATTTTTTALFDGWADRYTTTYAWETTPDEEHAIVQKTNATRAILLIASVHAEQTAAIYAATVQAGLERAELALRQADERVAVVRGTSPAPSGNVGEFLACTQGHESGGSGTALDGDYGAVNPSGTYRGAYQFSRSTWDSTARHAGRLDLVGVDPAAASPADQDAMAAHLYGWQGDAPWLGRC